MFVDDFKRDFYEKLIGKRVLILVNHDVDAVCATRILLYLLEADNIQYSLISIKNMNEFVKAFNDHCNVVKNVILINFGAKFNVDDAVNCGDKNIFIIDNHRPVELRNIYLDQIKLLMDPESCKNIPPFEQVFRDTSDEDDDEDGSDYNSREQLEKRKARREWKENRLQVLFEYTKFSYYGESAAYTLFNFAWKLSKDNYELLWLAIVGVSDLRINEKIEDETYIEMRNGLRSHLTRLKHRQNNSMRKSIDISYSKDLHLILYRHWTLFESFRHTLYTMYKFRVWNVKGYKRMLEFFAEVGIPLVQCKQKYSAMDLEFRQNCQAWIDDLCEKYGIDKIMSEAFLGSRGYKFKYNSNDVAIGVKAILESPSNDFTHSEKFLKALDALSSKNVETLQNGIELAKAQFDAIVKQVKASIEMKSVTSEGEFLRVFIQESAPDAKFFCIPGCLLTLARYILFSYVATSRRRRAPELALVIVMTDVTQPEYAIAAGIPPIIENSRNSFFGKAFLQAGQSLKCTVEADFYDDCVVRFPVEHKLRFIETLVSLLS